MVKKFVIGIRLWSKKNHPLFGIPGEENQVKKTGFLALPAPDPDLMMDETYANSWFFRDKNVAHFFDENEIEKIPSILTNVDSISLDDVETVVINFYNTEEPMVENYCDPNN